MFPALSAASVFTGLAAICFAAGLSATPKPNKGSAHAPSQVSHPDDLPIRGLHISAPDRADLGLCTAFIRDALPKEGVNTLVMEFGYQYQFKSHPEVAESGSLGLTEVRQIVAACKDAHIRLIPEIDLLGHQSWADHNGGLLHAHPEFDESKGKFAGNKGIYCRSYCPQHPDLHPLLFDLIDELCDACQSDAFHCGMDEIFILADPDCPRCKGMSAAKLFADEVIRLHDHLASKARQMWMWGDRFLDGRDTGLGEWEASANRTESAIDMVPKDIVICDWHYEHAEPTAALFASRGFQVVASPWRNSKLAAEQLALMRSGRANSNETLAGKFMGMLHTTWCGAGQFIRAYNGDPKASKEAKETAQCFKDLFAAIRARS